MRQPAEVLFADEQVTSKKASRSSAFQAPNKRVKLSNGGPTIKANGKTNGYLEQKVPKNRYTLPSSLKKNEVLNHQPRCDCCPHGFHLDLGFVKFAEDVATGKEQIQNWSSPSKRARHIITSPVPSFASPHLNTTNSEYGPDSSIDIDDRLNNSSSVVLDSSILSKSMDDQLSELEDVLNQPTVEFVQPDEIMNRRSEPRFPKQHVRMPPSILKNSSDSNVHRVIRPKESPFVPIMPAPSTNHEKHHKSRSSHAHHQQRVYIPSPPSSKRYAFTLPSAYTQQQVSLPSSTLPHPVRASTPSKNANDEVRQIFSKKRSIPAAFSRKNSSTTNGFIPPTSAPNSPVPKPYYTAIAQSMAHLKKLPIAPSRSGHGYLRSSSLSNAAPCSVRYQYLENGGSRRHRLLSPEPAEIAQPNLIRHSNLQSRSYFHDSNSNANVNGGIVPYRYRGATSSLFDDFASVRRMRINELISANQFETTSELLRSLSPTPISSIQKWSSPINKSPSANTHTENYFSFESTKPKEDISFAAPTKHYTTPPAKICVSKSTETERIEDIRKEFLNSIKVKTSERQVQTVVSQLENSATQTGSDLEVKKKSVAVDTVGLPAKPPIRTPLKIDSFTSTDELFEIPVKTKSTSVAIDTSDLLPLQTKKVPPAPPPKPKDVNLAELRKKHLSHEFQFCLGHEPEHHPDEDPPHISKDNVGTFKDKLQAEQRSMETIDRGSSPINFENELMTSQVQMKYTDASTETSKENNAKLLQSIAVQTEFVRISDEIETSDEFKSNQTDSATQTESTWFEEQLRQMVSEEKAKKRRSVDKVTETDDTGTTMDEFIMISCKNYDRSSLEMDDGEVYEKIQHTSMAAEEPNEDDTEGSYGFNSSSELPTLNDNDEENILLLGKANPELPSIPMHSPLYSEQNKSPSLRLTSSDEGDDTKDFCELPEIEPDDQSSIDTIETDAQTVIMVECAATSSDDEGQKSSMKIASDAILGRTVDPLTAEAVRKLLIEPQRLQHLQRNVDSYRSFRMEKGKAKDLDFMAEKCISKSDVSPEPSTPTSSGSGGSITALKEMVNLKKAYGPAFSAPEPIPAKIPRPKFARYSPTVEQAETPDEVEEAVDRLTPLRSEMRPLTGWGSPSRLNRIPHVTFRQNLANEQQLSVLPENDEHLMDFGRYSNGEINDCEDYDAITGESSSSSDGNKTYDANEENEDCSAIRFENGEFELATPLKDALEMINDSLLHGTPGGNSPDWAFKYTQHEWLKLTTKRNSNAELVEAFIDALEAFSTPLMETVVNLTDQNGNTALHYAVSHENYDVVSILLDSKVCKVDEMNKAGYSAVMLGALCELKNETEIAIIHRLFQMGNVNAKALKHEQTALMLAASHGRVEAAKLLLRCGSEINAQDSDGSSALMCAAEHGQKTIVILLLKQPNIDALQTDCDNQTALSIASENNYKEIARILYSHLNIRKFFDNDSSVAV